MLPRSPLFSRVQQVGKKETNSLPVEGGTDVGDGAGDVGSADELVGVGKVRAGDGTLGGRVVAAAEVDVVEDGEAIVVGVKGGDGALGVDKGSRLDEGLGTHAGVDARGGEVLVQRVVDVEGAEADAGVARVDVDPVVVGVGDAEVAGVLVGVAVRVADEGALPVVVEVRVGDGDIVRGVGHVEETVVVILADVEVTLEVDVVDPDVGAAINADGVAVVGVNAGDAQVADDDVADPADVDANVLEVGTAGGTNDGLVARGPDLAGALDAALNDNYEGLLRLGGLAEGGEVGHGGSGTAGTTGGAAVGGGEAEAGGLGDVGALLELTLGGNLVDGGCGRGEGSASQGGHGSNAREEHVGNVRDPFEEVKAVGLS